MREKIISQLKAKFSGVNLSKARMDAIADRLTPKITDEAEIDTKLDELNELVPFAEIARQDDKIRDLESKVNKKPKDEQKPNTESTSESDDLKTILDDLKKEREAFRNELQALKSSKAQDEFIARAVKEGFIPNVARKYYKDVDFDPDAAIAELKADFQDQTQFKVNVGVGDGKVPRGTPSGEKEVSKDIVAFTKRLNESEQAKK